MSATLYAAVTLVEGMHFRGTNPRGQGVDMDSRPAGEPSAGASPAELVLQAAGGCTGMDVVFILRKRKLEPEVLEVKLEGSKRDELPRIYEAIKVTFRAKGAGITLEDLEKAAGLSFSKYCSVINTLKPAAKITYSCEIIP